MFGKLLGENVPDLDSEEHLMYNITLSLHGRTLVSTMHMYIIHMVYGGSLLHYNYNVYCGRCSRTIAIYHTPISHLFVHARYMYVIVWTCLCPNQASAIQKCCLLVLSCLFSGYEYFLLTVPFYQTGFPVYIVAQPHTHYT